MHVHDVTINRHQRTLNMRVSYSTLYNLMRLFDIISKSQGHIASEESMSVSAPQLQ